MAGRLLLDTDYRDYYDFLFDPAASAPADREATVYRRATTDGPSRPEMFAFMRNELGLLVPEWDMDARRLAGHSTAVVLWTDLRAHRGEGKRMIWVLGDIDEWEERLRWINGPHGEGITPLMASQYIASYAPATTIRQVYIGDLPVVTLLYASDDTWRSNVGNVHITRMQDDRYPAIPEVNRAKLTAPIVAVDYVYGIDRLMYAIDYNIAPGLDGTTIEDVYAATEVYEAIERWTATGLPARPGQGRLTFP